jgi:diguanylate cyclase (GGDEF)-like protein
MNETSPFIKKYKIQFKYMIFGILFGLIFPVIAWLYEFYCLDFEISILSIKKILDHNPLMLMINSAPLFLGVFALITGTEHAKIIDEKQKLTTIKNLLYKKSTNLEEHNENLSSELSEHKLIENKIRHMAYHDPLTGLPNKLYLKGKVKDAIRKSIDENQPFSIMYIDVDNFKSVNDTSGHSSGDELLRQISSRLTDSLRNTDTVARIGGDEFVVLLDGNNDILNSEKIALKLCENLNYIFKVNEEDFNISVSIGISIYPIDGDNMDTLVKSADLAMYTAKARGKNKFVFCTPELIIEHSESINLSKDLYKAIELNQFFLEYQPQINSIEESVIGCEALLRWNHPDLGLISPLKFISLAERSGLIIPIGDWVLDTACTQTVKWQRSGYKPIRICVNISTIQLMDENFTNRVKSILERTEMDPQYLEMEITESISIDESKTTQEALTVLKEMGITITIDDFGTGYSSFNYLKNISMNKIKIDKIFTDGIGVSDNDESIIKAIISLAKKLDCEIIAEGVETKEQLEFLKNEDCFEIQGYYYHKPLSSKSIESLLKIEN